MHKEILIFVLKKLINIYLYYLFVIKKLVTWPNPTLSLCFFLAYACPLSRTRSLWLCVNKKIATLNYNNSKTVPLICLIFHYSFLNIFLNKIFLFSKHFPEILSLVDENVISMTPLPITYILKVQTLGIYILETAPLRSPKFQRRVNNNSINLQFKFQKHSPEQSLLDNYL